MLDQVDSSSVESVVSDVPTRVYPVVVVSETFGMNYSVWASYFREVRKGFSPVGDQAEFSYIEFQVGVGKEKASKKIGWSLVQKLLDDLGMMDGDVVESELVCFIVDS